MEGEPKKETPNEIISRIEDELNFANEHLSVIDMTRDAISANRKDIQAAKECVASSRELLAKLKKILNPSETER